MEEDLNSIKKKKSLNPLVNNESTPSDSAPALGFNASTSFVDNSTGKPSLPDTRHTHQQKTSSNNHEPAKSTSNHQDFPEIRAYYAKYVVYLNFLNFLI